MKKDWVIHTKAHLNKAETVVRYLARYTYRTAISLSRIVAVNDASVSFKWKDYRDEQKKIMTLEGGEFLRRFLLHILPKGLMRIRHYGYLANRVRVEQLEKIRRLLAEDKPIIRNRIIAPANESGDTPMACPNCKTGHLQLIGIILSEKERRRCLMN